MRSRSGWTGLAAAALLTGALLAPHAAVAAAQPAPAPMESGKPAEALTPAQKEVLKQLRDLRRSYREKLRTDSQAVVEKAVKDGRISRQEADQLLRRVLLRPRRPAQTAEEVKARLEDAVRSGKITREQADKILKQWTEAHGKGKEQPH